MPDEEKQQDFNLTGSEITREGKIWGGIFFIFFTMVAIVSLFAFWPDKVPDIKDVNATGTYRFEVFRIRLINDSDCCDSITKHKTRNTAEATEKAKETASLKIDTAHKADSIKSITSTIQPQKLESNPAKDTQPKAKPDSAVHKQKENCDSLDCCDTINLNTIFLILVAIAGFLGNMIHVATSFTTFVGNENFKKSWILWYIVKPFTASALAIIIYFNIRAGFLSYGSDARSISLYGILALSALAGLFTDTATLKLKEVFETIFRPKDERDGKLAPVPFSIDDNVVPSELALGANDITLTGKGLNSKKLTIKMNNKDVVPIPVVTPTTIKFSYTVENAEAVSGTKIILTVFDENNKPIFQKQLSVK